MNSYYKRISLKRTSIYIDIYKQLIEGSWCYRWVVKMNTTMSIDTSIYGRIKESDLTDKEVLKAVIVEHPKRPMTISASEWFDYHNEDECLKTALTYIQERSTLPITIKETLYG